MKTKSLENETKSKPKENSSIKAFQFLGSLMFLQLISRAFHFGLNSLITRFSTPEEYGLSALQLPFVSMAITRIFREAVHRAALRESASTPQKDKQEDLFQSTLTVIWLIIPVGILLSSFISFFFILWSPEAKVHSWMKFGLVCWLISSWMEMIIEPVVIYVERHLLQGIMIRVECLALFVQSLYTLALLFLFSSSSESSASILLLQSTGQLIYTTTLLIGYYLYALWIRQNAKSEIFPQSWKVDSRAFHSIKGFFIQSVGKYVTAEGEHAILFFFGTLEQQGIFEFVFNLGSMVARIVFLSIERTSFIVFSDLKKSRNDLQKVWRMMLNLSFMISLLYLATCPIYIDFLVHFVFGEKWSQTPAPLLLSFYGVYLLLIGGNGLIEALRDAASSPGKIQAQAPYMVGFIAFYFALGSLLMYFLGAGGLILAACMSTLFGSLFTINYFKQELLPVTERIPTADVWLAYALLFISGMLVKYFFGKYSWYLVPIGGIQAGTLLLWFYVFKLPSFQQNWNLLRHPTPSSKSE